MEAIILTRVSTTEQEEGHSLDAQSRRLHEYCERKSLSIIKEFRLVESSTRGDRPDFQKMLQYIESYKFGTVVLVADAVDRLQRSFKESAIFDDLLRRQKIELHCLRENFVFNHETPNSQKLLWDMNVMMAKSYVGNISDNVKRSNNKKLQDGEICGSAPIGYLNTTDVNGKKDVELDLERAHLIKKMYEEYASGIYSLKEIKERATQAGLRSKKGHKLAKSTVESILKNRFYYGVMCVNDELYPHKYERLITQELYDECQIVRTGKRKGYAKSTKTEFIFKGSIKCIHCGCTISPEIKKGKYVYLRPNTKGDCNCKQVNERVALEAVEGALNAIEIPDNVLEGVKNMVEANLQADIQFNKVAIEGLRKTHKSLILKEERLLDLLIDESITRAIYDKKLQSIMQEKVDIEKQLNQYAEATDKYQITLNYLIDLVSRASSLFKSSGIDTKRKIIKLLFSNLYLDDKNIIVSMAKPFDVMLKGGEMKEWLR